MTTRFYITTPIYYVNDVPHLGNAYSTIAVDALRRYHKLRGRASRMLTGTDEHGLKIAQVAERRGMTPNAFVDSMSAPFRAAWPALNIETDDFIRTTEPRHIAFVQGLWTKVANNGELYKGSYEDWYCVGCESFKTEKELLPGNICPAHGTPVDRLSEETYFFRLSKWEKPLLDFYGSHADFIEPTSRRNEVISFVEGGLRDLSVSRTSFKWGVPVPGDPAHVMYVWFDALANYLSALGPEEGELRQFWPPTGRAVHLVGKDILRFHAVYWPAFLMAAGYCLDELPSQIFAHGFLTIDGRKMSKSLRNAVDPLRLAREVGVDVLRYHLLRAVPFGQDGDFDHAALLERYNADLGKNLGNLLHRVLGLTTKFTESKTPAYVDPQPLEQELIPFIEKALSDAANEWETIAPHRALEATWTICSLANQYVDRAAPWSEAKKGNIERIGTILATLLEALRLVSVTMWPVMPAKSTELRVQLGLAALSPTVDNDAWPFAFHPRPAGESLFPGAPLFPTLDQPAVAALLLKLVPPEDNPPMATTPLPTLPETPIAKSSSFPPGRLGPITYDQFAAVELRVGLVVTAEKIPKKDKLLKLSVDVGEDVPRTIIAGLALSFSPEQLVGRRVAVVTNLAARDFGGGLVSQGMLLAAGPSDGLMLATIDDRAAPGTQLK